uniref:restriction endonuclease subunit S n=1 Tax=Phaeodactylibacter xiamenensis TaxID=1524460 RepID=UPI0024A96FA0
PKRPASMTHLLQYFPQLSLRPENLPELRSLILQLAVEGKLTAEWRKANPDVEPASELLARIEAEKAELVKAKKIKKSKPLKPVSEEEMPFELPEGWIWCRMQKYLDIRDGTHDTPKYVKDGIPLVTSKNLYTGKLSLENVKYISKEDHEEISKRSFVERSDILFAMIGSIGNPVLVDTDIEFSIKNVALFKYHNNIDYCPRYILHYLNQISETLKRNADGAVQSFVSLTKLRNYIIALPPLPEQQAIVQTVDALLQELDQLQQRTETRLQLKTDYATAALRRLTTAPAAGPAWEALAPHFRTFFDETGNVQALRAAILQLAVQGKLTAQWRKAQPDVEPATELLSRIQAEKAALVKAKQIKKEKPLPPVDAAEVPFAVPEGWVWCRMINIFRFIDYRGKTPKKISEGVRLLTAKNVRPGFLKLEPEEFMSEEEYINWMTRGFPRKGDLLFTTEAPLGNVCQLSLDEKVGLAQRIITLQPYIPEIQNKFLMYSIMSDGIQESIKQKATGMTARGIKASKLKRLIIPLPPLPEQHAIVQAVEELLGLCTALEEAAGRRDVVLGDWVRAVVAGV